MSGLTKELREFPLEEYIPSVSNHHTVRMLLNKAADEIEWLQSLAGGVSPGQSVADIKEHLRTLKKDKPDGS